MKLIPITNIQACLKVIGRKENKLELRVVHYFIAVATEKSISSAAKALHLSQPTLSRQLKELEEELGVSLFLRGNREITLTEEGVYFLKKAKEIVELVDKTTNDFSRNSTDISGEIFIGCGETEGMRMIAKTLNKLQKQYPNIRFHLYSGNSDDISEKLDNGLLDFGIFIEPTDKNKYNYLKLPYQDRWGVLMRKDSPLAERAEIQAQDIIEQPLLVSRQSMVNNEISGWLGKDVDTINIVGTYNLIYNAAIMVEEKIGIALCLDKLIPVKDNHELCFRPLYPSLKVNLNIVWKKNEAFSLASKKFLEQLREDIAKDTE